MILTLRCGNMVTKIKIAIVGVGNCASSLIQGIYFDSPLNGVLHKEISNYSSNDIEVVAAFDIDIRKVGKDISQAIFAKPNNTLIFNKEIPFLHVPVMRGPTMDGFANHMYEYSEDVRFVESDADSVDVVSVLKETRPDMLINYLPVGSEDAARFYADCCLEAGVSFVNAMPVFISSTQEYIDKFTEKNLICVGDDIKAQFGATIVHRTLINLMKERGVDIKRTYQLNTGGNTDFLNMLERKRLASKKISKTSSVQSQLDVPLNNSNIHVGPSDYVAWQKDNKVCFLRIEGELFGGAPVNFEARLSVEDSPNSAGVMIETIRAVKLALDRGLIGYLDAISSFAFKHPKNQKTDSNAIEDYEVFLKND